MKVIAPIVPLAAALAACHAQPTVEAKNATVAEVANKVAIASANDPQAIRAGLWSSTVTVEQIDAPGVPAEMVRRMKSTMGTSHTQQSCLTEEEAKNPKAGFFAGAGGQCKYDHFNMGGGKIDAAMRCDQSGTSQVVQMDGTYAPESYRMRMSTHTEGDGPAGGLTMAMRVDSKRIGQCPAKTS